MNLGPYAQDPAELPAGAARSVLHRLFARSLWTAAGLHRAGNIAARTGHAHGEVCRDDRTLPAYLFPAPYYKGALLLVVTLPVPEPAPVVMAAAALKAARLCSTCSPMPQSDRAMRTLGKLLPGETSRYLDAHGCKSLVEDPCTAIHLCDRGADEDVAAVLEGSCGHSREPGLDAILASRQQ